MKHYVTAVYTALQEVYAKKGYLLLSIITFALIFSFNVTITNYKLLFAEFSTSLFVALLFGSFKVLAPVTLSLLIIMAILAGIVVACSIFILKRQLQGNASAGFVSIIASLIAPSCSSCALGLLSILGLGGFIAFLPFKGVELGIIGVIALMISLVYLSQKIIAKTCIIKKS